MRRRRRTHSAAFKGRVALAALKGDKTMAQLAALNEIENSRVLWIPAATPPHKQEDLDLASAEHRLAMVRLATDGNNRFEVSDLEIRRGDVSYTIDTLRLLREENPGTELALLIGGDSLAEFSTWREPEAILEMARLLVYRRPGTHDESVPGWVVEHVTFVDAPQLDASSTAVRERIRKEDSVEDELPLAVLAYILNHSLYV